MAAAEPGSLPTIEVEWRECDFAVVDVETNGFSRDDHDVIEIAIVHLDGRRLTFDSLLKPRRRIGNRDIHGITNRDIRHAPAFADVAGAICDALVGRVVVAHNAPFDVAFLSREIGAAIPYVCTLELHAAVTGSRRDLDAACAELGVSFEGRRHRAAQDAIATARLLDAHLKRLAERGVRSIAGLSELRPGLEPACRGRLTAEFARSVQGRQTSRPRAPAGGST